MQQQENDFDVPMDTSPDNWFMKQDFDCESELKYITDTLNHLISHVSTNGRTLYIQRCLLSRDQYSSDILWGLDCLNDFIIPTMNRFKDLIGKDSNVIAGIPKHFKKICSDVAVIFNNEELKRFYNECYNLYTKLNKFHRGDQVSAHPPVNQFDYALFMTIALYTVACNEKNDSKVWSLVVNISALIGVTAVALAYLGRLKLQ